jgi:hypothetical protein
VIALGPDTISSFATKYTNIGVTLVGVGRAGAMLIPSFGREGFSAFLCAGSKSAASLL